MIQKIISILALSLCIITTQAQVTIGTTKEPAAGALLDLTQGTETNKGLGMPRVQLAAIDKLIMSGNEINDGDDDGGQLAKHVGLVVYHIQDPADICDRLPSGIYVWEGAKWMPIGITMTPQQPQKEYPMTATTDLNQPNSYIVSEPGVLKIPIAKAISIWNNQYQGDLTANSAALSRLLPTKSRDISTLELEAKLLWTTDHCSDKLILNGNKLEIKGTGVNRYIEVWVGAKKGNASIALVEKGKDAQTETLWSWHVWVTDMPAIKNFNNGDLTYAFMDRNLGATSATVDDPATIGLHYQWGRKDPFPMADTWSDTPIKVYDANENEVNHTTTVSAVTLGDNENRFVKSTNSPHVFLAPNSTAHSADWYSANENEQTSIWADRWGSNPATAKSPFDPCPEGWRVPRSSSIPATYPWNQGLHVFNGLNTTNFPWTQHGREHAQLGYIPAAGGRQYDTGAIFGVGTRGFTTEQRQLLVYMCMVLVVWCLQQPV